MVAIEKHVLNPNVKFYINRIEEEKPASFANFHKHDFFEIIWITEVLSTENHSIDFKEYELKKNQLWIISPNQVHYWTKTEKKGWVITIPFDVFINLIKQIDRCFLKEINIDISDEKSGILTSLLSLITLAKTEKNDLLIESYLRSFIINLKPEIEQHIDSSNTNTDFRAIAIINLIEENFRKEKESVFYAEKIGLTIKRANEVLKKMTSKTVKQHITERLIIQAKRDLFTHKSSIKEIGFDLGFQSASHFTKFFKQNTGFPPEEYKATLM